MKRVLCVSLLFAALAGCSRDRQRTPAAEPPPPDLTLGKSGGAEKLAAASAFAFVPEEAVTVGMLDPGQLFGDPGWKARLPALVPLGERLRTARFDPARTRLLFFGMPDPAVGLASAVVAEGKLSGVPGGRLERTGHATVHRFDGASTGIAVTPTVTVVGREPALSRALEAGARNVRRLSASAAFAAYREILDRLPVTAGLELVGLASPAVLAVAEHAAAIAPPALAKLLRSLKEARVFGAAVSGHASTVRMAVVVRMKHEEAVRAAADAARRAVTELRLAPGEAARSALAILLEATLSRLSVRERGVDLFLESSLPAELLVRLGSR